MTRRIHRSLLVVGALAAMAWGGAVFAQAKTSHAPKHERVSAVDTDNIQSGDQTTPDISAKKERVSAVDTDNIQSGDQTSPDLTSKARSTAAESTESGAGSESAAASDGPGGHADPAGATVDHQFSGTE